MRMRIIKKHDEKKTNKIGLRIIKTVMRIT